MRFVRTFGVGIFLVSVGIVLAGGSGAPKREDVPKYLKQLTTSQKADERAKAAEMLGRRGSINAKDVEDAVEPLKKSLQKDIDAKVRAAAALALGEIHTMPEEIVPILIDKLKNDMSKDVKLATAVALGLYGPDAKEAVPTLRDYAKKFDPKKSKEGPIIQDAISKITLVKKKKG
jgi:HEAT repeat protein